MKIRSGALFGTLFLAGCASLNPFKAEKAIDYNALTYGDSNPSSENRRGGWGTSTGESRQSRSPALNSNRESPAREESILDPAEETVKGRIEAGRGVAPSKFIRGDRATRADFYDNAPSDGSLWANENDGNYFFTKGKVHAIGDIVSVKIDDNFIRQIAEEVKKSLTPAEQEVEMALYLKNTEGARNDEDLKAYRNVASEDLRSTEAEEVKLRMERAVRWSQVDLSKAIGLSPSEELRAEIVDRYQNGNFKIRAVKRVLYRGASKSIALVAVAPVADFDEKDLISSGKLYEYKIRVGR
ncbi:MAG: flagellar basal body L-ring protein FlgH [Bdellovibrionales bacterium]|nr:flagellar basal body L-ring protein FlgH [Bdellovibrionales bacterium]